MARYWIDVHHAGLGKFQRITGSDPHVVERRAQAKREEWDRLWERQLERQARSEEAEQRRFDRDLERARREERKEEASRRTAEAQELHRSLESLLLHSLDVEDHVDFETLKDISPFRDKPPAEPPARDVLPAPVPTAYFPEQVQPTFWRWLFEFIYPPARAARLARESGEATAQREELAATHAADLENWRRSVNAAEQEDRAAMAQYVTAMEDFRDRQREYVRRQRSANDAVESLKMCYLAREPDAVEQYCDLVLTTSRYPDSFPKTWSLRLLPDAKMLVLNYELPAPEHVPTVQGVKYVQARDELVESHLADAARKKLYDSVIYQVAIRSLHELFEADVVDALDSITFNGFVLGTDPATGREVHPCILSVQAKKAEFTDLNLRAVDPKACFRKLKGVGSAQLHALAAVPPIVNLPRDDVRYAEGREVIDSVSEGTNLAAMDWEDFEHLIRQLFEREFSAAGAEVKVTRASRDGGVDAVILDPDPIRGGKYVVQAKRYTNAVGVAAVRDLYGTMINEGAVKGILVTTANFGADSYAFAKGKPITLIDGSNLLHMLHRHGTKAHIDIRMARAVEQAR
ncbi:restriction endonuclease [Myxococcota bacterium]|nr:restriction endonuclease [Myxococcota bacterium]